MKKRSAEARTSAAETPRNTTPQPRGIPLTALIFLIPALVSLVLIALMALPWIEGLLSAATLGPAQIITSTATSSPESSAKPGDQTPKASGGPDIAAPVNHREQITLDSPRMAGSPSQGAFWIEAPDQELARFLVSIMDDDEMLGQLFLFGWPRETATGPIMDWLKERNLAGIKVFGWNGGKLSTLATAIGEMQATALQSRLGIPLYTATDQEGGMVRHIKDTTSITPGNLALGADGLAWDAYQSAYLIGRELRAIGINMNYAPTVDVYVNEEAHVIGSRAFGSNAQSVAWLGLAQFAGYRDSRVIATAKHFPGHGDAAGDSHGMMPILNEKLDTLWNRDFLPYRLMIPEGLPAILIGHLAFPKISGTLVPASLNPALNKKLLRDRLHFDGIVITDDMFMGGASVYAETQGWGMSDIIIEAIKAGNDIIMMSRTPDLQDVIWQKLKSRYRSDGQFKQLIQDAVTRSLLVKLAYLKPDNRVPLAPDPTAVYQSVPDPEAGRFFSQQAGRAVTVITGARIPFQPAAKSRIALIGQATDFLRAGQAIWPRAETMFFAMEPFFRADSATIAQAQAIAARSDWVIFCLANPNSREVLASLKPWQSKILVVSTLTPIYLEDLPWVKTAVAVYGQSADSFRFGLAALIGSYQAPGVLPVRTRP